MKNHNDMKHIAIILATLSLASCVGRGRNDGGETETAPRTTVTLTHARYGNIRQEISFPTTTAYQLKSSVTTPVSAYVNEMFVTAGSRVEPGQRLFSLESKEQHAVGGDGSPIWINASAGGIVLDVLEQVGNYVQEGTPLCTVADASSLVFEINVPGEQMALVRQGKHCRIALPDGTRLEATVRQTLATMNTESQSFKVIAHADSPFLPEGLNVNALFSLQDSGKGLVLPEEAVQSDETLTEHWVMTMSSDSAAVRIPVKIVGRNASEVEVESDQLTPEDNIIMLGSYGLEDGAKIKVADDEQ